MWGRKVKKVELEKDELEKDEKETWSVQIDGCTALIQRNNIIFGMFRLYDVFSVLYKSDKDKTTITFYNNRWIEIPGNCAGEISRGIVSIK